MKNDIATSPLREEESAILETDNRSFEYQSQMEHVVPTFYPENTSFKMRQEERKPNI